MTLKEYAQIIGDKLVIAYHTKDRLALTAAFREADQALEERDISPAERKDFWEEVSEVVHVYPLWLEKQANSSLITLMQTIEREIAARATGTGK